ncbi:MAG: diguanylate cyclase, partial [Kangiellaceae bacterium]|nr:diguanylate cyclase [Kangiellaceae bacterium]
MAKQELPTTTGDEITLQFRAGRLLQILYATEVALMIIALQRFMLGTWGQSLIVIGVAVSLISVYLAAKKGKVDLGATILLCVLTLAITFFMWRYEGTKDETLLAFPSILVFAVIIGNRYLFSLLLIFMLANIFMIGYLNDEQIYINELSPTNLDSAVLVCVILMLVGFSIWILSSDLRSVLEKLSRENLRVLRSQKQVKKLLHHDALTNLPNRILARDRFEQALLQSKRDGTLVSIMFVDLDNFKNINDSLGHTVGDNFLVELSKSLVSCLRKSDSVCRLGGDEFLIVLERLKSKQEILQIVEKIIDVIKQPILVDGNFIAVTGSIGVAIAPDDGKDFDSISRKADMAMYRAKDAGKNSFCFYDRQMNIDAQENICLVADLQKAIKEEQLHVVFQPKIDLLSCETVGAEALVRWHHPERGSIPPVEFIPLAESSGFIIELGE